MPKCACNRCGQHIEYDSSHEGLEVLCPGCDNITMLENPKSDRSIPSASPVPSPGDLAPAQTAVPKPPASAAKGPTTRPPVVAPQKAKSVTPADRIPPTSDVEKEDDALPAKFAPGPRRKVAPPQSPAPPPPPPRS